MLTISIWQEIAFNDELLWEFGEYPAIGIFLSLFFSIFTLPIDLIFLPIQLIGFIIYKIANK